jgi:aspartate kinase
MEIIVQKYGGTSLADPEQIKAVATNIAHSARHNCGVVAVVSAMGSATDRLIELARQVNPDPPTRELDMLMTAGERVSMALLSMALDVLGVSAISFTGSQVGIITDTKHTKARILEIRGDRVRHELACGRVVIVAGFQGVSMDKEVTTLGRGGSDTTAVAMAAALEASRCEIYTDVDGVFAADPRVVPTAKRMDHISYDEMLELASLGARVVHHRAIEMARKYNVELMVGTGFNKGRGTVIGRAENMEEVAVRGVTSDREIALLTILSVPKVPGSISELVTELAEQGVAVRFFFHGLGRERTADLSFIVALEDYQKARDILKQRCVDLGAESVVGRNDVAMVSIVGSGVGASAEFMSRVFQVLSEMGLHIEAVSTSELKVSCVIAERSADEAVRRLATCFELTES